MAHDILAGSRFATIKRGSVLSRLLALIEVSRQRRRLTHLEPHMLADVGLTREAALNEAKRGFWDVPSDWPSAPRW